MSRCFFSTSCCCLVLWFCLRVLHVSCQSNEPHHFADPAHYKDDFLMQSLVDGSKFPSVSPNGEIFLTNDPTDGASPPISRYNVGRVIYKEPISLKGYRNQFFSFNTSFKFNITTATSYNESGDGLAFVLTTDAKIPNNSTGRFLGLMPESPSERIQSFLAVEFDTFQNLQAEINDPSASHIGIDISNLSSVAHLDTSNELNPLYLYNNYTITAWLSYSASTQLIQVWATNTSNGTGQFSGDPVLTFPCNLSQVFENHTDVYVGIIAASGNNSQASILYTWSFMIIDDHASDWSKLARYKKVFVFYTPILFIGLVILAGIIIYKYEKHRRHVQLAADHLQMQNETILEGASSGGIPRYSYAELERATKRFSEEEKLGEGGFSIVYKGVLAGGTEVAVKRMKPGSMPEAKSMAREMKIISKARHSHLLQLKGWCYERNEALLVYEYMPNGSLDSYLHGTKRSTLGQNLDSEKRFNIIVGVAAALEYLHENLPGTERVLHRDVKSANVLLTRTMKPMLADFGLSRLVASDNREGLKLTMVMGTPGYVAPEVLQTERVDDKADVYSFGVLTLEVACGRRAIDSTDSQRGRVVDWVGQRYQGNSSILEALDPLLAHSLGDLSPSRSSDGQPSVQLTTEQTRWLCVLHLGLLCCQTDPGKRPEMSKVHQALKESKVLPVAPDSWVLSPAAARASASTRDPSLIGQEQGAPHSDSDSVTPLQGRSETLYFSSQS